MISLIMRQGKTVLFSSHILGDVERVSDRIVVIDKGVLRANCSLEEFRAAVKKVILSFSDSPPTEVNIEGLLHCRRSENELELILVRTADEQISKWADDNKAENFHIAKMNLEDQFIEYTAPANHRRLFRWEET
jgi:ABC-2 type transport system ATP-binding protein